MVLDNFPPPLAQLCHTWALAHVGEYAQTMHALVPNTLMVPLDETKVALYFFYPLAKVNVPLFVDPT